MSHGKRADGGMGTALAEARIPPDPAARSGVLSPNKRLSPPILALSAISRAWRHSDAVVHLGPRPLGAQSLRARPLPA